LFLIPGIGSARQFDVCPGLLPFPCPSAVRSTAAVPFGTAKIEITANCWFGCMAREPAKLRRLRSIVASLDSTAVAFSGGVDSTLVARVARDTLKKHTVAVTITSPVYPDSELRAAKKAANEIGIEHVVISVDPLKDHRFVSNPPERCYLCKREDLSEIKRVAEERGLAHVVDGTNADDGKDFRPGLKAKQELGVRSPLAEAGIGKVDARAISKFLGLPTATKRSSPCLASRIPYGESITREKLMMIEEAEDYLVGKGFEDVRVRMHGSSARIEVDPAQIARLGSAGTRIAVSRKLKSLGFMYVSIDMDGYRMGSLNRELKR